MTKFDNVMHNSTAHRIILNVPNTAWNRDGSRKIETHFAVSYTHLTLPTIYSV